MKGTKMSQAVVLIQARDAYGRPYSKEELAKLNADLAALMRKPMREASAKLKTYIGVTIATEK